MPPVTDTFGVSCRALWMNGPTSVDVLELVELAQWAGLSPDVVEVEPVVALALEVDARRQPLLERAERYGSADAETSAVVKALEVDVREGRGILEAARNAEDRERRFAAALELAPHRDPSLSLSD